MTSTIRLIKLLWAYPLRTLGGLLGIVISDAVQLTVPWLTGEIVDRLSVGNISQSELSQWVLFILFLAVVAFLAKQVWRHLILGAARRTEAALRASLMKKTLSLSVQRSRELEAGKFLSLASNDVPAVGQALAFGVVAFFDSIFITLIAFGLMYKLSPALTAYAALPFPILAGFMLLGMKLIYSSWDKVQKSLEELTEKTRESLGGMRTLRAYGQAEGDSQSFRLKNENFRARKLDYAKVDAVFAPLILLFAGSSSVILLYFGGSLAVQGSISVGTIAAFAGYLGILTWPMIAAGWMLVLMQRGSASLARIDELLNEEPEKTDGSGLKPGAELEIRDLSFSYGEGSPALRNIELKLASGKSLGVAGPVGSGKSTLLKLLQGLHPIPPNCIFLNGEDASLASFSELRSKFSYVSQEPYLFSDTIANNIRMARPDCSPNELNHAVAQACLSDDIALFPQQLDTLLGEKGVSLSGGQKQRTALARALVRSAPILLLDDTLSAVDSLTEKSILNELSQVSARTQQSMIIVSHRLSAIEGCDEIIVLNEGKIVQRGTHRDLASQEGIYKNLHSYQNQSGEPS